MEHKLVVLTVRENDETAPEANWQELTCAARSTSNGERVGRKLVSTIETTARSSSYVTLRLVDKKRVLQLLGVVRVECLELCTELLQVTRAKACLA